MSAPGFLSSQSLCFTDVLGPLTRYRRPQGFRSLLPFGKIGFGCVAVAESSLPELSELQIHHLMSWCVGEAECGSSHLTLHHWSTVKLLTKIRTRSIAFNPEPIQFNSRRHYRFFICNVLAIHLHFTLTFPSSQSHTSVFKFNRPAARKAMHLYFTTTF